MCILLTKIHIKNTHTVSYCFLFENAPLGTLIRLKHYVPHKKTEELVTSLHVKCTFYTRNFTLEVNRDCKKFTNYAFILFNKASQMHQRK